ncbi:hypothetical protein BDW62DRAFT_176315 [Aspergillus aurantiobrunneus]
MREQEAALTAQQSSLRDQLEEVRRRASGFEGELLKTITDNQLSRDALRDSFSTLQGEFARKEEDLQALQESLSSIQKQLGNKEEECQAFQDSLRAVQGELAESQKERQVLQESLSSIQNKAVESASAHQALQNRLSSIQNSFARKEEECGELNKELEVANSARTNLESGKSKAKAEILALLKRVQDSESGMKKVREILHHMDVANLEQPLPKSLEQLESVLQAANARQATAGRDPAQVRTPETSARAENPRPRHEARSLEEAQTDARTDEPRTPGNQCDKTSLSKQTGNIVPFSSILQGLSPIHFPVADNEACDLSCVLAQTPERTATLQEPTAPARPDKDSGLVEVSPGKKAQEAGGLTGLEHVTSTQGTTSMTQEQTHPSPMEQGHFQQKDSLTTRKVSFLTRKLTTEIDNLQIPDSQEKSVQNNLVESSLDRDNPTRTNRWTYSKRQRETSTRQQEAMAPERVSSQAEEQQMHSKKAKTSSASSALATQARTGSELYDRRKSPTRLASGSSHTSSKVPIADGPSRSRRRSGRRTRGDKYDARFSQGA